MWGMYRFNQFRLLCPKKGEVFKKYRNTLRTCSTSIVMIFLPIVISKLIEIKFYIRTCGIENWLVRKDTQMYFVGFVQILICYSTLKYERRIIFYWLSRPFKRWKWCSKFDLLNVSISARLFGLFFVPSVLFLQFSACHVCHRCYVDVGKSLKFY